MFLNLFFKLRAAEVPVSLREHLTLIEAMDAGLVLYDVEEFYLHSFPTRRSSDLKSVV